MLIPQAIVQSGNSGRELSYTEVSSTATVTATVEATPQTVISANALVFDGATRISVEFQVATCSSASANAQVIANLWDDTTTDLGRLWVEGAGSGQAGQGGIYCRRFFTPSTGTHTYRIRCWRQTADVTLSATSPYLPIFMRISEAPSF